MGTSAGGLFLDVQKSLLVLFAFCCLLGQNFKIQFKKRLYLSAVKLLPITFEEKQDIFRQAVKPA
jgi:hypothetical protein